MIANRRPEFPAAGRSPLSTTQAGIDVDPDAVHYVAWAEGIKCNQNPGAWSRWSPRSYHLRGGNAAAGEGFKWLVKPDNDDFPSPRLWEKPPSASASASASESSPRPQPPAKSSLLNNPPPHMRAQYIAMYRQEMIESMRDVPESAYELSLRDLVDMPKEKEQPQPPPPPPPPPPPTIVLVGCESPSSAEKEVKSRGEEQEKEAAVTRRGRAGKMARSESMDIGGGFLLRMFFPFGRRKKNGGNRASDGGTEWSSDKYKDRCSSSGSSGSTTSTSSSSTSSASTSIVTSRRKLRGCYSFFLTPRSGRV